MWDAQRWNDRYQAETPPFDMTPHDFMYRQRDEVYRRVLPRGAHRTILEVGAAPGDWLVYFYWELHLSPTGIDFAPQGVEAARRKLAHFGVPGEVLCADFMEHDFGEQRFDIVFFQGSLEHFPDPQAPLLRARALCKPGGMICAQIPWYVPGNLSYHVSRLVGERALAEHYLRGEDDLAAALLNVGLTQVNVERLGTYQLTVEPDAELSLVQRALWRGVSLADRLVRPVVARLDLRSRSRFSTPYLLGHGRVHSLLA